MTVPLELFRRNAAVVNERVENFRNAARQRRAGEGKPVAHGVAGPDLDRHLCLFRNLHQLLRERDDEAVEVSPCNVFEVAAGNNALLERRGNDVEVRLERVFARHIKLEEDVIVRAGGQDPGLLEPHLLHELEVVLVRPDPAGDLRIPVAALPAEPHRFPVLLRIEEKLGLADHAVRAAHAVHEVEDVGDLLRRIRRPGLLAVAEGGVRDPDVLGDVGLDKPFFEHHARDARIGEHVPVQDRLLHVLELEGCFCCLLFNGQRNLLTKTNPKCEFRNTKCFYFWIFEFMSDLGFRTWNCLTLP